MLTGARATDLLQFLTKPCLGAFDNYKLLQYSCHFKSSMYDEIYQNYSAILCRHFQGGVQGQHYSSISLREQSYF